MHHCQGNPDLSLSLLSEPQTLKVTEFTEQYMEGGIKLKHWECLKRTVCSSNTHRLMSWTKAVITGVKTIIQYKGTENPCVTFCVTFQARHFIWVFVIYFSVCACVKYTFSIINIQISHTHCHTLYGCSGGSYTAEWLHCIQFVYGDLLLKR